MRIGENWVDTIYGIMFRSDCAIKYMARKINHLPFPQRLRGTSSYCRRHAILLQARQSCCKVN